MREESNLGIPGYSLDGRVAKVTRARRGIGEAIAPMFAGAVANVVVSDAVVEDGQLETVADGSGYITGQTTIVNGGFPA